MGSASASPDYAAALSTIQSMSRDQLQELLDEPSKLDDYVKSLQQIRVLYNKKGTNGSKQKPGNIQPVKGTGASS